LGKDQDHVSKLLNWLVKNRITLYMYGIYRSECYDYLFSVAVEMKKAGLDPEKFEKA